MIEEDSEISESLEGGGERGLEFLVVSIAR
jgi:hypothetical protein